MRADIGARALLAGVLIAVPSALAAEGAIVVSVEPASPAARTGLQPGDRVVAWSRSASPPANAEPADGSVASWFDLLDAEVDQGPRGTVTLRVERDGRTLSAALPPTRWGLETRPGLDAGEGELECWRIHREAGGAQSSSLALEARRPSSAAALAVRSASALVLRGESKAAEQVLRDTLEPVEAAAPGSLAAALIGERLAVALQSTADPEAIWRAAGTALGIAGTEAPRSSLMASIQESLGIVAAFRSDWPTAEPLFRESLALREALDPDSVDVARSLTYLGGWAWSRGDLDAAEGFHRRALELKRRLSPGSTEEAYSLFLLGLVDAERFEDDAAEDQLTAALRLYDAIAPRHVNRAAILASLGELASRKGHHEEARGFHRRALELFEERSANNVSSLVTLDSLARENQSLGALDEAQTLLMGGLEKARRLAADSAYQAYIETSLGSVALDRGDLGAAQGWLDHACLLWQTRAPGSTDQARALHALGEVHRRRGDVAMAATSFGQALDALEAQGRRLGASEDAGSLLSGQFASYYRDQIDALVSLNRSPEAWLVSERYRGQTLSQRFAQRDLTSFEVPAELDAERARLERKLDTVQGELHELSQDAQERSPILLAELRGLRREHAAIADRVRRVAPRVGSIRYPQPLDFRAVSRELDGGTALLAYSVGRERTVLLVIGPRDDGLHTFVLPVDEAGLRERARRFRAAVDGPVQGEGARSEGESLFELLLSPALPALRAARRVLVLPDGPLHQLPFAALRVPGRPGRFVAEWKPLHVAPSATLYAELRRQEHRPRASSVVVAFGDPSYPKRLPLDEEVSDPIVRREVRRGRSFAPLPASRGEAQAIAGLFPARGAAYLGDDATEERAKALPPDVRYVHFACHALLNERSPLDSALALTIRERPAEGQDNGLLQAREIFSMVRLRADLVTLSACESGLGAERGGEGLVGLTQAFLVAGARSVVASLWSVDDDSTRDLMVEFYRNLRDGKPKDRALQDAQVAMIRRGLSPFHWAAFQLTGDWR